MDRPSDEDVRRAARALNGTPVAWREVSRGGQTAAGRWIATLDDGRSAFVKIGWTLDTASWVRDEHLFYARTRGLPFVPRMIGWDDDGESPVLALEDLSGAHWPPAWRPGDVDAVLAALAAVAATAPPPDVPNAVESQFGLDGWPEIEVDPGPFLALELCSAAWLENALPIFREAAPRAQLDGDALLHFDVRSDNVCIRDGRAILIDWNFACVGNPLVDVAAWLPSLQAEGGPTPEQVIGHPEGIGEIASLLAGYFCAHAGRPAIPEAPQVRPLQLMQSRTALPWAARALGIPPPA
ncbi:MAG TPA: phosphotransferase [Actinomycetota bacterium]|jgi:hypothetical protein|nr:phosphotransferase [Actinomycetota bacterium]